MTIDLSNPSVFFEGCTVSNKPESYRLVQKRDGTLVLQGLFEEANLLGNGLKNTCHKWRDIPTVIEELKGE